MKPRFFTFLGLALLALLLPTQALAKADPERLQADGNYQEAYTLYRERLLEGSRQEKLAVQDLASAVQCLRQLNQIHEVDGLLEEVTDKHAQDWRVLRQAAYEILNVQSGGFLISGEFSRGYQRRGNRYVHSRDRDRAQALQWMLAGHTLLEATHPEGQGGHEVAAFYTQFAYQMLDHRNGRMAWRLQLLTDLETLPDYSEHYQPPAASVGTAVDEEGKPVLDGVPASFEAAVTDGERWRWLLEHSVRHAPSLRDQVDFQLATFVHDLLSVETLQQYGNFFRGWAREETTDNEEDESGTYAIHTLGEHETIARLANGIKRFDLPEGFNYIEHFKRLTGNQHGWGYSANVKLARIHENRRQYERAAHYWEAALALHPKDSSGQKALEQIRGKLGRWDGTFSRPAGERPELGFVFRNGEQVDFTATRVDVEALVDDIRSYLESNPDGLDHERIDLHHLGYRLIEKGQSQYLRETVADWSLKLKPAPKHWDRRVQVEVPVTQAGAYLIRAKMRDGNESALVLWLEDTAIVTKQMDKQRLYYLADARSGQPLAGARLDFLGFRQEYIHTNDKKNKRRYQTHLTQFSAHADAYGEVVHGDSQNERNSWQWLFEVSTRDGRKSWHGFEHVWLGQNNKDRYAQQKTYLITDRPVYRPGQAVKIKAWLRTADYALPAISRASGDTATLKLYDPKGAEVLNRQLKADEFGGLHFDYKLDQDATLGSWRIRIKHNGRSRNLNFRVEEYKKPEFEVSIEAPSEPIILGDKVVAKLKANYYFGAPVTEAKVKIKVERSEHDSRWYPIMPWDWFYGPGYWWFCYDYSWYPGWKHWGCRAPSWQWGRGRGHHSYGHRGPPELVQERELELNAQGEALIEIDTALAKLLHGKSDHRYQISAEVTDQSRRTIYGSGQVLVARKPYSVVLWADRGYYEPGQTAKVSMHAHTLDGRAVRGKGTLTLYRISYDAQMQPSEEAVYESEIETDAEGYAHHQLSMKRAGQYRLSCKLKDAAGHRVEGGYFLVARGENMQSESLRFDAVEIVPEKREYRPGEKVKLLINTAKADSHVLLFVRASNGFVSKPEHLRLQGKSGTFELEIEQADMPNIFVEALTVADGQVHTATRELIVPPEKRVLNVELTPDNQRYRPGEQAQLKVRLTDHAGKPFVGTTAITVYDKSLEYISGGSNVTEIREFFWKWRRHHYPQTGHNLKRYCSNHHPKQSTVFRHVGIFGHETADLAGYRGASTKGEEAVLLESIADGEGAAYGLGGSGLGRREKRTAKLAMPAAAAAPESAMMADSISVSGNARLRQDAGQNGTNTNAEVQPTIRKDFADLAYWSQRIDTDENGEATITFDLPENLTSWKIRCWGMGHGTVVGEGTTEIITSKDLIIRLQSPRFFVQYDEAVLSANVHNYLETDKEVRVELELDGGVAKLLDGQQAERRVTVEAGGEVRVDWRVRITGEGNVQARVLGLTDEESDAMELEFPAYVHGMLKTVPYSRVVDHDEDADRITFTIPAERRPAESRLEVRFSPTLATAMVDALPYLIDYPYGCTEQTLNRFLPAVITQDTLKRMGVDLAEIAQKRTNLNAQELGKPGERAKRWKRYKREPVFSESELDAVVKAGIHRLGIMQNADGGWGWFYGSQERSYPHTTAVVVRGLLLGRKLEQVIPDQQLERGLQWLAQYQQEQLRRLQLPEKDKQHKPHADHLDAYVYHVLQQAERPNSEMAKHLYDDRNHLAVYAKALFALAMHDESQINRRDMLLRNIEQYLKTDEENQSAWLELGNRGYWWYWYGSDIEAHAAYLKLLAAVKPRSPQASGLAKYLLNNRKHGTYWGSTRDTALSIEALSDYLHASGEGSPEMDVELWLNGKKHKEVTITRENLFSFDNTFVLEGEDVKSGEHVLELRRKGEGQLYFNAYVSYFTLEKFIEKAGLEIKVRRDYYKLERVEATKENVSATGKALRERTLKYKRIPLKDGDRLLSGDLVEVELTIESKNDYTYLLFEDFKPAGLEPLSVQSGYTPWGSGLRAYQEFRDEKVAFFVQNLPRGTFNLSYRTRAEVPGYFHALPTRGEGMYAPELVTNSDEIRLHVEDR